MIVAHALKKDQMGWGGGIAVFKNYKKTLIFM